MRWNLKFCQVSSFFFVSSLLCHSHLRLLVLLNSAKGRQNFRVFWGQHWVLFKGFNEGRIRDCFGAQRGCIWGFLKGLN
jgi:hypothetical protein